MLAFLQIFRGGSIGRMLMFAYIQSTLLIVASTPAIQGKGRGMLLIGTRRKPYDALHITTIVRSTAVPYFEFKMSANATARCP